MITITTEKDLVQRTYKRKPRKVTLKKALDFLLERKKSCFQVPDLSLIHFNDSLDTDLFHELTGPKRQMRVLALMIIIERYLDASYEWDVEEALNRLMEIDSETAKFVEGLPEDFKKSGFQRAAAIALGERNLKKLRAIA